MRPASALLLLSVPLSVWVAGCAAGLSSSRAPASPEQGRAELAQLEGQIAQNRAALGLPPRGERTEAAAADQSVHHAGPSEAAPAPAPAAAPSPALERNERQKAAGAAAGKEEACSVDPCRYTRAICDAAARICDIARYLGDDDSRGRCGRAQQDCSEARRTTRDTCPGC